MSYYLSLQQLHSSVVLAGLPFKPAGRALLWDVALASSLLVGMWLSGAYLGCLFSGSEPDVFSRCEMWKNCLDWSCQAV